MNVDLAEFLICLSTIVRYGKQDFNLRNQRSLGIPWARTDIGLSRCDVKGKVHVYGINIYKQPINYCTKRASTSNSPKLSFRTIIYFKRHWCIHNHHHYPLNVPDLMWRIVEYYIVSTSYLPCEVRLPKSHPNLSFDCQSDESLASLATTSRIINVYGFLVVIMLLM